MFCWTLSIHQTVRVQVMTEYDRVNTQDMELEKVFSQIETLRQPSVNET